LASSITNGTPLAQSPRPYDVVLYGASGFTGVQTVEDFRDHAPAGLRWAIAGRSREKLEQVRSRLGIPGVDILIAEADDQAACARLAASTRVVLSTAGPFAKYAPTLIHACVEAQTHWCDITGETPFVKEMIDQHHVRAVQAGAQLIPLCGFDSVPSDLGTLLTLRDVYQRTGRKVRRIKAFFGAKGGFNGGTLASALDMAERKQQRVLADLFLLDEPGTIRSARVRTESRDPRAARWDADLGRWVAPFFMGPINSRVVRRTESVMRAQGRSEAEFYSSEFVYTEEFRTRSRWEALAVTAGLGLFSAALAKKFGRRIVRRFAPTPGQGPSVEQMDGGWFQCVFIAEDEAGQKHRFKLSSPGDPGNRVTVKILCEAARLLAASGAPKPGTGGVLTPALSLGERLWERLEARGMRWERVEL
jgi:short subunit dehydrogenase-like uncharacterized protein